jgi:tetratricopeptide (TPR) repeat protein
MSTCARLGDFGRAAEWYDAAYTWCEPQHAASAYPGICRIHRAGILRIRGDLTNAEAEAQRAAHELEDFLIDVAGEAFYELGEIRLRMGDLATAETMFGEAHARGRDPQPGLAMLRLVEGKAEAARPMIERALAEPGLSMLDRAKLLPAAVEIRLAVNDVAAGDQGASELQIITETYASPALVAQATLARGRVELAAGRPESALPHLRRASRIWTEIDLPLELGRTRLLLSQAYTVLGNVDEAALEARAAAMAMARVGPPAQRRESP